MYPNKLTTNLMSSYSFLILTFFHEIPCSTCHKSILSQQNCKMSPYKNKNSPNVSRDVQNLKQIFKPKFKLQISLINFVN